MSALKKITLLILILAVAGLLAFGIYYLFFIKSATDLPGTPGTSGTGAGGGQFPGAQPRTTSTDQNTGINPTTGLPIAGAIPSASPSFFQPTPVTQVVDAIAKSPSLDTRGGLRYENAGDGRFYKLNPDGTVRLLSDQQFYDVDKVTWATSQDKAVLEYPDGSKILYNFELKKQVSLPKHWEEFSFSPDSSQVAAKSLGLSPENRWLVTTNDDGTQTVPIEPLGDNADKVTVDWSPSRQAVAFSQTGQALGADRREVLLLGLNGENFKSLIVEGLDFQPQWSPTGKQLLYSVDSARSDFKPELWIVNAYGDDIGSGRRSLKINTWADKCSFADDTSLFCAVPRDLPQGAGMSPEAAAGSYDDLYKIDLKTGLKTPIPLGTTNYHISSISFDKTKNRVLFTDPTQKGVFEAKL